MKFICKLFLLVTLSALMLTTPVRSQTTSVVENGATIDQGKYTILNNKFGNPDAYQGCWRWLSGGSWGWGTSVYKNDLNTLNVPAAVLGWHWSTPRLETQLPTVVWNNDPVFAKANWEIVEGSNQRLNVGYTLWFHDQEQQDDGLDYQDSPKVRIAVWLHDEGGITPQGAYQDSVYVGQNEWEVWRDTSGSTDTITFRAIGESVNNEELTLGDFIIYVVYGKQWMTNDKILSGVEFGAEIETGEGTELHVSDFYIDVNRDDAATAPEQETMYVSGRDLYSSSGEKVLLRGVNEQFCYIPREERGRIMGEIAKTNANCVRITWTGVDPNYHDVSADALDEVITQCIDNKMIPMLMNVDASSQNLDQVGNVVDFWTSSEVVQVINKHKKWLILNIANEAGLSSELDSKFESVYIDAIDDIRSAGITVPLVIDALQYGTYYQGIFNTWEAIRDSDPQGDVMFSFHTYWGGTTQERQYIYDVIIDKVSSDNIPVIFGEGPQGNIPDATCSLSPYNYGLQELQDNQIGWIIWSWGASKNTDCGNGSGPNRLDLTVPSDTFNFQEAGFYGEWNTDFAEDLIVLNPNGLEQTSVRPEGFK